MGIDHDEEGRKLVQEVNAGKQIVASAVGEGATAALMIQQYPERTQGSRAYKGD